jgi:hypothetical protein
MVEVNNATFERTGRDSQRHAVGLVTVVLSNGLFREFENVDENDFETWQDNDFRIDRPPYDMLHAFGYWIRCNDDNEYDEEDDEEYEYEEEIIGDDEDDSWFLARAF